MRHLAPLINVLGLLCVCLWWCLTGLGARLVRGLKSIATGARRGGFCGWMSGSVSRGWMQLRKSAAVWRGGVGKIDNQAETGGGEMMRDVLLIGGGLLAMLGVGALIVCQSVHWFAFGWPVVR